MRRRVIDRLDDVQDTRDTGVFFCFRFLHVKENEASTYKKLRGSVEPLRVPHQKWRV